VHNLYFFYTQSIGRGCSPLPWMHHCFII